MNQSQRNFLIEKIKQTTKIQVDALSSRKKPPLNLSNYVYNLVMTDKLRIKPEKDILAVLKQRALNSKEGESWLLKSRHSLSNETGVILNISDLFIIPEDFQNKIDEIEAENKKISQEIANLESKSETLIIRIQLSSDKVLQSMINEVDNMGNLTLMDTKLKLLS